ncbi:MAG: OmpA family protein [Myxococcaceae bacterium]
MRTLPLLILAPSLVLAQVKTVTEDRAWKAQTAALKDTLEAEYIVRTGDVDNLGFDWPEGFDPFCGRMTEAHGYPWEARKEDTAPFDRILLSSKFRPDKAAGCNSDGYSGSYDPKLTKPAALKLPLASLKGATVRDAWLQVFIDDFQSPSMCSHFVVTLNGKRFAEFEKVLNAIDQGGPVGKLITVPIPEEFYADLTGKPELAVFIDEALGVPDGFAIDFVRLLVNRKRENTCKGTLHGRVVEKDSETPLPGARVTLADKTTVVVDAEGTFTLANVPTGFEVVTGSLAGYEDGSAPADIGQGDENPEVVVRLEKAKTVTFDSKQLKVGEALNLANILFDQGKAELKKESFVELQKIVQFMKDNPRAEVELSGHTSSEGDAASNRSLSYRRVKACKDWVVGKGIDAGRIIAVGHGPDRPVASNADEAGRKLNRRVELRVVKID